MFAGYQPFTIEPQPYLMMCDIHIKRFIKKKNKVSPSIFFQKSGSHPYVFCSPAFFMLRSVLHISVWQKWTTVGSSWLSIAPALNTAVKMY